MISLIIPAYNEEALLAGTVRALRASGDAAGVPYEIIVVDDGSTDRTAEIARTEGARVVAVTLRNIGATRNAGARVATGVGESISAAQQRANRLADRVLIPNIRYRRDIGDRLIARDFARVESLQLLDPA